MSREKNLSSDNKISLKVSFTVETYYPAFRPDRVSDVGYPRYYGDGMSEGEYPLDLNGYPISGGVSDLFPQPTGPGGGVGPWGQPGYGQTGSFYNTKGTVGGSDKYGSFTNKDFRAISPRRTRWFDNILKARETASGNFNPPKTENNK
jgi:hypothetical protein